MAYKPGDTVLEDEPFALAVLKDKISVVCSWCLKTIKEAPLSLCAGCKVLKYCSSTCQKEDWKKGPHKNECKYLKNQIPSSQIRLTARVIFKLRAGLGNAKQKLPDGTTISFNSLKGHKDRVLSSCQGKKGLMLICKELCDYLGKEDIKDLFSMVPDGTFTPTGIPKATLQVTDRIIDVYCKVQSRVLTLVDRTTLEGHVVAEGLNLLYSTVKHSCYPNTQRSNIGRKTILRSVRKIERFGDTCVAYNNVVYGVPRSVRRAILQKQYGFHCHCDECKMVNPGAKEREAIRDRPFRCGSCKKRGKKNGHCLDCAALGSTDDQIISELHDKDVAEVLTSRRKIYIITNLNPDFEISEFHPELWSHVTITLAFSMAVNMALKGKVNQPAEKIKDWKKAEEMGQLRVDHRKAVCPGNLSYNAFPLIDLARVKGYLKKYDEANELIKQAQEIWKISFGPNNKLSHMKTIQHWMQHTNWAVG